MKKSKGSQKPKRKSKTKRDAFLVRVSYGGRRRGGINLVVASSTEWAVYYLCCRLIEENLLPKRNDIRVCTLWYELNGKSGFKFPANDNGWARWDVRNDKTFTTELSEHSHSS